MSDTNHPIEGLMETAMENIKSMVDVNTILGDPVETPDGTVIVPVSRVSFGFVAGGTEFEPDPEDGKKAQNSQAGFNAGKLPFGGGSGAGITLQPVAFLVVGQGQVRLLPVGGNALYDRLIDAAPAIVDRLQTFFTDGKSKLKQERVTPSGLSSRSDD